MIARYKGLEEFNGLVWLKPGSMHTIKYKRKGLSRSKIWLMVDGLEEIPYTLEELFTSWEPVE